MKKLLFLLVSVLVLTVSCGESTKEREDRIDKETAKILVAYNQAKGEHTRLVNEVLESTSFLGISNSQLAMMRGPNWQQEEWDILREQYKLDSLQTSFKTTFGEDDYNILLLKINDNIK